MMFVIRCVLLCLAAWEWAGAKVCSESPGPRQVLFLQSYHVGQPMEDGFIAGLRGALDSSGLWVELHVEYMDGKRFPSPHVDAELDALFRRKYGTMCFDALVVADNIAFDFAKRRSELFADLPLVFLGINNYQDALVAGMRNVTGIAEDVDLPGTLDLIHALQPEVRDLWMVADRTETGWRMRAAVEKVLGQDSRWRAHWLQNETYASLLDSLADTTKPGVGLLLTFSVDRAGTMYSEMEFLRMAGSRTHKALYTMLGHQVVDGVVGGSLLSNREHGAIAGRMLLDILRGKPADSIPILADSPKMLYVDYQSLRRYGIAMDRVPTEAHIGNVPFSPWRAYRNEILGVALAFLLLLVCLGVLLRMRTKLQASRERYRELVDHAHSVILRIDQEGYVQFINEFGERLFGYSLPELRGRTIMETIVPEHDSAGQSLHELIGKLLEHPQAFLESENENITKDGRRLWIHWFNRPLFDGDGKLEAIFSVGTDVTEKYQRAKDMEQFNHKVAHDLRSPLITIRSFAKMLPDDLDSGDQEAVRDDVKYIQHASDKMERQVEELIHLFRVGTRPTELTRFQVEDVVEEARMLVAGRLQQRGVQVRIAVRAWLTGDCARFIDIMQNLLDNAAKHMAGQEYPCIEVGSAYREGRAAIFVRDNGVGIAPGNLEKIFEVFVKLDSGSDGPGLGLCLVRRMVEAHGGRIWAESEGLGHGTTFWLRLDRLELMSDIQERADAPAGHDA